MTSSSSSSSSLVSDVELGFGEQALAAAVSAIIVNPLDVANTRLQAQAAGVLYHPSNDHLGRHMASNVEKKVSGELRGFIPRICFLVRTRSRINY